MSNYLLVITEFNKKLQLKKLNINEVIDKMNQIEDLLRLNYHRGVYDPTSECNKVCRVYFGKYFFNDGLFPYIGHYKHLSNDENELKMIFKIGKKIANKFYDYIDNYNIYANYET